MAQPPVAATPAAPSGVNYSAGGVCSAGPVPVVVDKQRNENYFERMGSENASRPADLHPSQGGRYAGFGSSYEPSTQRSNQGNDVLGDAFHTFSKGLSFFTAKTVEVAKLAATQAEVLGREVNEHVIKPTTQKLQDPNLRQNISSTLSHLGKTVVETSDRGIHYISGAIAGHQGYAPADGSLGGPMEDGQAQQTESLFQSDPSPQVTGGPGGTTKFHRNISLTSSSPPLSSPSSTHHHYSQERPLQIIRLLHRRKSRMDGRM